ncbi:hypothetical protein K8I31_09400, partial [bacterium]|nr:hypothetical protein [bacterium]
ISLQRWSFNLTILKEINGLSKTILYFYRKTFFNCIYPNCFSLNVFLHQMRQSISLAAIRTPDYRRRKAITLFTKIHGKMPETQHSISRLQYNTLKMFDLSIHFYYSSSNKASIKLETET